MRNDYWLGKILTLFRLIKPQHLLGYKHIQTLML